MAITGKIYGKLGAHILAGDIDWTLDTFRLALATSSYAVSQANDEFFSDVTNEIAAGGGYSAGGFTLAGESTSYDSGTREQRQDATDVSVGALTPSSPYRYAILYKDTGVPATSPLIGYLNFGADQDPAGLPFAVQWAATGVWFTQAV